MKKIPAGLIMSLSSSIIITKSIAPNGRKYTVKTYTVQNRVSLNLSLESFGEDKDEFLGLNYMNSENAEEDEFLSDGGEMCCWDAGVEIADGVVKISGATGPSGPNDKIVIVIPLTRIKMMEVEDQRN